LNIHGVGRWLVHHTRLSSSGQILPQTRWIIKCR
jgi:hypothetical protein